MSMFRLTTRRAVAALSVARRPRSPGRALRKGGQGRARDGRRASEDVARLPGHHLRHAWRRQHARALQREYPQLRGRRGGVRGDGQGAPGGCGDPAALVEGPRRQRAINVGSLTARHDVEDRVRGLEFGADDYLVKPLPRSEAVSTAPTRLRPPPATSARTATRRSSGFGCAAEPPAALPPRGSTPVPRHRAPGPPTTTRAERRRRERRGPGQPADRAPRP